MGRRAVHEDVWHRHLPAQDLGRATTFYSEKVALPAVESPFLEASDGRVGLAVGDGINQLFIYPARARSTGEFTQAVLSGHRCTRFGR